jgi:hypothetical protein
MMVAEAVWRRLNQVGAGTKLDHCEGELEDLLGLELEDIEEGPAGDVAG